MPLRELYERRRARRPGVEPLNLEGAVSLGVKRTLGVLDDDDHSAGLRALAVTLAGELDTVLSTFDHSPTHSSSVAAQLRATLGELRQAGPLDAELDWFLHGEPGGVGVSGEGS